MFPYQPDTFLVRNNRFNGQTCRFTPQKMTRKNERFI